MYAFLGGLAEAMSGDATLRRSGSLSRNVWQRANGHSRRLGASLLLTRAAIPGAVAALNRLGVGPLEPGISGEDLRRGGLAAMRQVAEGLVPDAAHVIFGHTHRPGPLPGDDEAEWTLAPRAPASGTAAAGATSRRFVGAARAPGALLARHA